MNSDDHDPARRKALEKLVASATVFVAGSPAAALDLPADTGDPREVVDLWPGPPPGATGLSVVEEIIERDNPAKLRDRIIRHVRRPRFTVFRARGKPRGAFLVLPGGGYRHVVIDKEGFETARWLASEGFTAFVLFYRLPGDGWSAGPDAPLQDAQRALRLLRARAGDWQVDPAQIGVLGFSAGGHLAARTAAGYALRCYGPVDAADGVSARPDLAALMYPVITLEGPAAHAGSRECLLGPEQSQARLREYSAQNMVGPNTPPSFLVHAGDDVAVPLENSLVMYSALRSAGVDADLHVFQQGGHGFGLRGVGNRPLAAWPGLLRDWAMSRFGPSPTL